MHTPEPAQLCACGCAEATIYNDSRRQQNRFVHGHNNRQPGPSGPAPLCECGCGQQTAAFRRRWNKRIVNHNRMPRDFEADFWARAKRDPIGCWEWQAGCFTTGYGAMRPPWRKSNEHASRIAFRLAFGDIPPGLLVCHTCDNPLCVRPSHLWLGTARDNYYDSVAKGRAKLHA
jgi:hypothetical protein